MTQLKRQQGLTTLGWLIVIIVFGLSVSVVSKLGPHYLDNRVVVSVLKTFADDPAFPDMSVNEVKRKLAKTFRTNNIRGKALESIKVVKQKRGVLITVAYEERIDFMGNIDVVLEFDSQLDSNNPGNCCRPTKD